MDTTRRLTLKHGLGLASLAAPLGTLAGRSTLLGAASGASISLIGTVAQAQQVPFPSTAADVTPPAPGIVMHAEYAKAVGRMAYLWGWPMVNMINRRAAITQAPEPGRLNGVLPAAPRGQIAMLNDYIDPGQTFIACPNQDVVYGLGFFSLD